MDAWTLAEGRGYKTGVHYIWGMTHKTDGVTNKNKHQPQKQKKKGGGGGEEVREKREETEL